MASPTALSIALGNGLKAQSYLNSFKKLKCMVLSECKTQDSLASSPNTNHQIMALKMSIIFLIKILNFVKAKQMSLFIIL